MVKFPHFSSIAHKSSRTFYIQNLFYVSVKGPLGGHLRFARSNSVEIFGNYFWHNLEFPFLWKRSGWVKYRIETKDSENSFVSCLCHIFFLRCLILEKETIFCLRQDHFLVLRLSPLASRTSFRQATPSSTGISFRNKLEELRGFLCNGWCFPTYLEFFQKRPLDGLWTVQEFVSVYSFLSMNL